MRFYHETETYASFQRVSETRWQESDVGSTDATRRRGSFAEGRGELTGKHPLCLPSDLQPEQTAPCIIYR